MKPQHTVQTAAVTEIQLLRRESDENQVPKEQMKNQGSRLSLQKQKSEKKIEETFIKNKLNNLLKETRNKI